MDVRGVAAAALLAFGAFQTAPASPPASQQRTQQPPIFRTGAELVRVDVTVLNGRGEPVTTLTKDDFVLEEDGVRQTIQSFALLEHTGEADPASETSLEIETSAEGLLEAARDDVRVFVIFWNEYHIPPYFPAKRLRDELSGFLRTMMKPTDVVALMDQWTQVRDIRFTRDVGWLVNAVTSLRGRQGVLTPPRNIAEENHLREARSIPLLRAQVSLSALKSTMAHLGTLRQGRTALLFFSRELGMGRDSLRSTLELIQTANDANVAFYLINPDGLEIRSGLRHGILSDLARNTGGEALLTNSVEVALARAVKQSSASYILGYAPSPMRHDGKFHKIKVGVRRSGMQVRARNGYLAPTPTNIQRAREEAAAAAVAPEIESAFGELTRLDRALDERIAPRTTTIQSDGAALTLGQPDVYVVRRPADLARVFGDDPPAPEDGREFVRTDRLIVRGAITGSSAAEAMLTAKLVDRKGRPLMTLPVKHEAAAWTIDLPLSSIARGDYVLALEAHAGDHVAAAYVPLRVKP